MYDISYSRYVLTVEICSRAKQYKGKMMFFLGIILGFRYRKTLENIVYTRFSFEFTQQNRTFIFFLNQLYLS